MKESITKVPGRLKAIIFNIKNIPDYVLRWGLFIVTSMAISLLLDKLIVGMIQRIDVGRLGGDGVRMLQSLKEFGQPMAILVAFLLIFAMDKARRKMLPRLLLCVLLPSVLVWPLKLTVHRLRPYHAEDYSTTLGLGFFSGAEPAKAELSAPLAGKEKIAAQEQPSDSDIQSFPSAHTATAFGFAVGLSRLYPAGQLVFYGLAVGCGLHRVLFGAHWFSDVVAAVFIGILLARAGWRWKNKKTPARRPGAF
ncbi:MAG: phosphatase PAP2 family protein [Actinobacteria bacterium]|nr:phosphatase PAP2 family protein [Actinomycetota bacterium]